MKERPQSLFGGEHAPSRAAAQTEEDQLPKKRLYEDSTPTSADESTRILHDYFALSVEIEQAKSDHDYPRAIRAARATYPTLRAVVDASIREYGSFYIVMSHAVHTGGTLMAVMGDREGIEELRTTLAAIPELELWRPEADSAARDLTLVEGILAAVKVAPGLMQSELKSRIGTEDGRRVSTLVAWLEKARRLRRVRKGTSYQLYPMDVAGQEAATLTLASATSAAEGEGRQVASSAPSIAKIGPQRPPAQARPIDLEALPYIRLPMAPPRWEERARAEQEQSLATSTRAAPAATKPRFIADGEGWSVTSEEKLAHADRPDPAYKDVLRTGGTTFWLDRKGRREGFPEKPTVIRVTDRNGALTAERGLDFDVYRSDVNTDGSAILFLSREGILHGYTQSLEPILLEKLQDLPEYAVQAYRLGIESQELKNHVRCVAISADRSCYLATIVDEAWCLSTTSDDILWGLRMPTQEGWVRVAAPRSASAGTSREVDAALRLMELDLPVTPTVIAQQYRRLALRWHPDRNPSGVDANDRMQRLNAAIELLMGIDLGDIDGADVERVTYEKVLHRHRIDVPGDLDSPVTMGFEMSVSMGGSEKQVADWIYAANFAASDNRVYLAGYSGKVVEVSPEGSPMRAYDIGAVPRQIADTGTHLYLLTDTRLYILAEDRLDALIDVFDQGDLLIADGGFGLLDTKAFSWYRHSGQRVGGVRTKDPIRRIFSTPAGLVVETRKHRASISGAPSWWDT